MRTVVDQPPYLLYYMIDRTSSSLSFLFFCGQRFVLCEKRKGGALCAPPMYRSSSEESGDCTDDRANRGPNVPTRCFLGGPTRLKARSTQVCAGVLVLAVCKNRTSVTVVGLRRHGNTPRALGDNDRVTVDRCPNQNDIFPHLFSFRCETHARAIRLE